MTPANFKKQFINFYSQSSLDQFFVGLSKQDKKNYFSGKEFGKVKAI